MDKIKQEVLEYGRWKDLPKGKVKNLLIEELDFAIELSIQKTNDWWIENINKVTNKKNANGQASLLIFELLDILEEVKNNYG